MVPGSYEGIYKCLDSAKKTIELIYDTYEHQEFFRTWSVQRPMTCSFALYMRLDNYRLLADSSMYMYIYRFYNTTYTIFAASVILVYINQEASEVEIQPLLKLVSMAIEVLETMADECVVAGKSAKLLQKAMDTEAAMRHEKTSERLAATLMSMTGTGAAASTPSDGGGGGGGGGSGSLAEGSGVASDPLLGTEWRHCWGPGNLLDNDMLGFDFGMPFIDCEARDGLL